MQKVPARTANHCTKRYLDDHKKGGALDTPSENVPPMIRGHTGGTSLLDARERIRTAPGVAPAGGRGPLACNQIGGIGGLQDDGTAPQPGLGQQSF